MSNDDNIAENLAHVPEIDGAPPNTHPTPTRPSGLADELRAGTSIVSGQPAPTTITPRSPHDAASRGMPIVGSAPSGATVRSFSPTGVHDTDGK